MSKCNPIVSFWFFTIALLLSLGTSPIHAESEMNAKRQEILDELRSISRELQAIRSEPKAEEPSTPAPRKISEPTLILPQMELEPTPPTRLDPPHKFSERKQKIEELRKELNEISQELSGAVKPIPQTATDLPPEPPQIELPTETPLIQEPAEPRLEPTSQPQTADPVLPVVSLPHFDHGDQKLTYVIIRPGISFGSDINYNGFVTDGQIETGAGFALGIDLGRRFANWEIGGSVGFVNTPLENFSIGGNQFAGEGDSSAYLLNLGVGYNVQIANNFSFKLGSSLGFAKRHSSYDLASLPYTLSEDSFVFLGELHLSMLIGLTDISSLFAGYRFSYLGENGPFESEAQHRLEIGAMFNW